MHLNIEPMKPLVLGAKTLLNYKEGIIQSVIDKVSNGKAQQHNASIQKLFRGLGVAHGYRNFDNLRAAILFFNGQLNMLAKGRVRLSAEVSPMADFYMSFHTLSGKTKIILSHFLRVPDLMFSHSILCKQTIYFS